MGDPAPAQSLRIVLDTGRYVVADKPSGLLSVPGKGPEKADCVRARVAAMYPKATGPMTVHRLDQDTSGLIVVGLDADAQRAMSQVFEHRKVTKRYIAVVEGELGEHAGLIDLQHHILLLNI
ncbi:MAG: RNA pseudouridine synthase [Phycisphaerales bacterium]|nr:RNA pseudouridine synthase [Phycisphaerales bacterium]